MSGYSASQPFKIGNLVAGADLSTKQYRFVKLSGVTVVAVTGTTDRVLGVLLNKPLSGDPCEILVLGVTEIVANEAVTAGDTISTSADGEAVPGGANVLGIALTSGATGDLIAVLVSTQVSAAATLVTGDQTTMAALTDSTGQTPDDTIANVAGITVAAAAAAAVTNAMLTDGTVDAAGVNAQLATLAADIIAKVKTGVDTSNGVIEGSLSDLAAKINAIRTALRASGLMA